jgi:hypothetical protein
LSDLTELEVVVLTRDRPALLTEMVASLLPMVGVAGKVWVSDNSVGADTAALLRNRFPQIATKRRDNLEVERHFAAVIGEIELPYCMILHDDDYMLPAMREVLEQALSKFGRLDACGFNAVEIVGSTVTRRFI